MRNLAVVLSFLVVCSCATQPMKPEDLQSKIALGMSTADVIATLGIPQEKKMDDKGQLQLTYDGYELNFLDNKLNSGQVLSPAAPSELQLKPVIEQKPDYVSDSIVLNKNAPSVVSAYQVAGYLNDEALFEKAVAAGVKRNGFTVKTNALCVALTEGFLKGTEAVLKTGFDSTTQLRTEKGTYTFPEKCVSLQKDPAVAEQLKKLLSAHAETSASKAKSESRADGEAKSEDSKSSFDWSEVEDFLKPTAPPPTSRVNH